MTVSREQLRRALLVAQAIFTEAERRGYSIEPIKKSGHGHHAGVGVAIRGHPYAIEMSELQDKVPLTADELADWDRREQEALLRVKASEATAASREARRRGFSLLVSRRARVAHQSS